jgi:glutamate synthase (NADPH/NADH) large chain
MTGGIAVILGKVGDNFAAGMTGGMAFVYDAAEDFPLRVNDETVVFDHLASAHWERVLKELVTEHARETQSRFADQLLHDWALERGKFWHVVPKEMLARLKQPMSDAAVEAANRA